MGRKECSVKCEVWRNQWEVRSVKCEVWSVKFKFGVRSAQCEVWSVKCEVWSVKEAVGSEKCEVWSVECEVSSLECEKCSVKCGVWSVKTLLRLSLKKSNGCRGKDTVGTGCLWTIGHLCLGNFRRRLARVYVININYDVFLQTAIHFAVLEIAPADGVCSTFCFTPPLFLRHTTSLSLVSSTISPFFWLPLATTIFIIFGWIMHHGCSFFMSGFFPIGSTRKPWYHPSWWSHQLCRALCLLICFAEVFQSRHLVICRGWRVISSWKMTPLVEKIEFSDLPLFLRIGFHFSASFWSSK